MFSYIFTPQFMKTFVLAAKETTFPMGSMAGSSVKIMNFTNYDLTVNVGAEQVDIVPAYQYLVMPNEPDIFITIAGVSSTNYVYPNAYVAAKTFQDVTTYEVGSLIHFMSVSPGDTVNVSGNMTIGNTASVNIMNTPAVTISGTANVNIGNVPAVTISGTPSVTLSGTTNQVNIGNTPNVIIQGTPQVNVSNNSIAVTGIAGGSVTVAGTINIGNTPAVSISGTPSVNINSGSVNATIQNAQLNSNVTNALLSTNPIAANVASYTFNLVNFASGTETASAAITLPSGYYDAVMFHMTTSNGNANNYLIDVQYINLPNVATAYPLVNPVSSKPGSWSGAAYFMSEFPPSVANAVTFKLKNNSGASITDSSVVVEAWGRYATATVTNKSNAPVTTSGNYYGTGADGVLNVTANSNVANTDSVPFIGNYSSITLSANLGWSHAAKYAILYCTGDVTINSGATLYAPPGVPNIGAPAQALSINGKSIPNAGNGGNGGPGGPYTGAPGGVAGGSGGAGNCFTSGNGGGGGGGGANGSNGAAGGGGGTGYGTAGGGNAGGAGAQAGGYSTNNSTGALIIVAAGNIIVNGTIYSSGTAGGAGGNGFAGGGGGGGGCGTDRGGNGAGGGSDGGGGGGSGGAGGGVVFLFAGGQVLNNGSIQVNGGAGGGGGAGAGGAGNGAGGAAGQVGSIQIYQYGGNVGGGQ